MTKTLSQISMSVIPAQTSVIPMPLVPTMMVVIPAVVTMGTAAMVSIVRILMNVQLIPMTVI